MSEPGETCEVWWARPASAAPHLLAHLSADERARHARLRQPADSDRYLVAHALLRILLGERLGLAPSAVSFAAERGKPRLAVPSPTQRFSLSHSGRRVVVAITAGVEVGVDVEQTSAGRDVDALVDRVLNPHERATLTGLAGPARRDAFYRYWVRKEAAVKATGDGLRMPLTAVTVSAAGHPAQLLSWDGDPSSRDIRLQDLDPGEGHVACLATLGAWAPVVVEHDATALLGAGSQRTRRER